MYRSDKLLRAVKDAPICFRCGAFNTGADIAPAHSNQLADGKGRSIKAHDFFVAALCNTCHTDIDSGKDLTHEERVKQWDEAWKLTIRWLFLDGRIVVK